MQIARKLASYLRILEFERFGPGTRAQGFRFGVYGSGFAA